MNLNLIESEVLEAARRLKSENPDIRSLLLECTDMLRGFSKNCGYRYSTSQR